MGQFKPMVKMMTTEPSVILKLKKGGHVNMKDEACEQDGHSPMRKGLTVAIAVGKPRGGGAEGASPGKPSMSERRKAMAAPFMKKGGKTMKKAYGGSVDDSDTEAGASPVMAEDMMRGIVGLPGYDTKYTMADVQNAQKAGNSYKAQTDNKARGVVGLPGGDSSATMQDVINSSRAGSGMAAMPTAPTVPTPRVRPPMRGGRADIPMSAMKKGGSTDMGQDKAMIRKAMGQHDAQEHKGGKGTKLALKGGGASSFVNTKMSDGDKNDRARGTSGVRTGAAGYKDGGTISGNAGKFLNNVSGGDRYDSAKGTGGVKMANSGGYKMGGSVDWANRPADTMKPGVTGTSTAGVRNSNAGGFKTGGSAKKAYATGGSVDTGRPVAYASKPVSKPVSNTAQSGTFKKGGKVSMKADGGPMVDRSRGAYDKAIGPDESDMDMARSIRSAPGKAYDAVKRFVTRDPGAGAGRGFVNPPMARKKGGVMCKADGGMIGPDNLPQGMPGAGVPAGMPTGMPPMGMPTMANQPSLAAQEAMQKVLGAPDTGGLSGYKRGGSAKRVHRHTSAALRAMQ